VRRELAGVALLAALVALAACDHARPYGLGAAEPNVPLVDTFPRQLTYSVGLNAQPSWYPDGSAIIYAFNPPRADNDRCLGVLPAEGGHLLQTICHVPADSDADSTNVLSNPAVGPRSRLAYLRESSLVGAEAPESRELVVATLAKPDSGHTVLTFPYIAPSGTTHFSLSCLHWLSSTKLTYLAMQVTYYTQGTLVDTITAPIEVVVADVSGPTAALTVVPGTAGATSVATAPGDSTVLYVTMAGDSIVYAVDPVGGARSALYDFGGLGVALDGQAAGGRLIALAGASTARLGAGFIYAAALPSGAATPLTNPGPFSGMFFEVPALAPSGALVVAEGHPVDYIRIGGEGGTGAVDTLVSESSTLWLFRVP